MIKEFDASKIDDIMKIWLETNIDAHDFIDKKFWNDKYEMVKNILPHSEILVYEEDVVKGFVGIIDQSYMAGLFVAKQFQGCGIGSKLMDECKKRHPILKLDVYVKNRKSVNFYNKHGFKIEEEKENSDTNEREYAMQWQV